MLNKVLLQKEWKSNRFLYWIFAGILTMYAVMIILMFNPKLGDSLRLMAAAMPQLFAAFGMLDVGTTLLDFINGYLYGMLFVVFPGLYALLLASRLVVRYVDDGSMAYLLATPQTRRKIIQTQAWYLIQSLFLLTGYLVILIAVFCLISFPGALDLSGFLRLNIGLFGLLVFYAGIFFFVSCTMNERGKVNGINAAVLTYAVLVQMIAQMGDRFRVLRYITPQTLFDTKGLIAGDTSAYVLCLILYAAGAVFVGAGIHRFVHRNIPV